MALSAAAAAEIASAAKILGPSYMPITSAGFYSGWHYHTCRTVQFRGVDQIRKTRFRLAA
jgi:hypothetical protein